MSLDLTPLSLPFLFRFVQAHRSNRVALFQSIAGTAEQGPDSEIQPPNSGYKRGPGSLVIVGNIHVLFNPKRGDVKLGQVCVLFESAHALSEKYGGAPVTIGGDFNSTPKSDPYKFIATSEVRDIPATYTIHSVL